MNTAYFLYVMPDMSEHRNDQLSAKRLFRYQLLTAATISNFWGVHWVHPGMREIQEFPLSALAMLLKIMNSFLKELWPSLLLV